MRNTLGLILLLLLMSCKSEPPKYQKTDPVQTLHAGQYILRDKAMSTPFTSERYVLSPDGSAERHILKKRGRYGDFYLDRIERGQWEGLEGSISVRFETADETRIEVFDSIRIQPADNDADTADTLWVNRKAPDRVLRRIAAFR